MKMKKISLIVLTALVVVLGINATYLEMRSDIPTNADCGITNTAIGSTERMVFKAYYNWQFVWLSAGEADFRIRDIGDAYEVKVYAKTYKSYDAFFRVRDYFSSEIDKKSMLPRHFVRIVEEGNYRKFDSLVFDRKNNSAMSYNGPSRAQAKKKYMLVEECTHDLLSVFYYMRNMDVNAYKIGEYVPTKLLFDEKIYPIKVKITERKKNNHIKDVGTFHTVKVVPDLITGTVFKDGNKMNVWVTDDANKLPLLIESPLAVGSAKALLKSYSGLKNEQKAKVK